MAGRSVYPPPRCTVEVSGFYDGKTNPPSDWPQHLKYTCAVDNAQGKRLYMEDSHILVAPFNQNDGQGFFAVFDGHEGIDAADFCGKHFHEYFLEVMKQNPALSIPGILEQTFKDVDCHLCEGSKTQHEKLKASAEARGSSAIPDDIYRGCGCTAVVAFLRIEDHNGQQSFLKDCNPGPSTNPPRFDNSNMAAPSNIFTRRRVLYCANAGDSHGVLCRGGKAIRLTYHHHTSNAEEVERINGAGGQIKKGYVQGHIMVTRSLGDYPDEGYVIGTPEQTQTELCDEDEFVILASDGLWDVFEDQQAVEFIRDVKNPEEAATNLVNGALEKGTQDNVTVIVIRLKDFPVHVGEETTNLTWSISQHGSREGGPLWRRMFCCP